MTDLIKSAPLIGYRRWEKIQETSRIQTHNLSVKRCVLYPCATTAALPAVPFREVELQNDFLMLEDETQQKYCLRRCQIKREKTNYRSVASCYILMFLECFESGWTVAKSKLWATLSLPQNASKFPSFSFYNESQDGADSTKPKIDRYECYKVLFFFSPLSFAN